MTTMTEDSRGKAGIRHVFDGTTCHERLWSPIDPSGLLRSCCACCKTDLHSQLVFNNNPSEILRATGNHGPLPDATVHVVPTGERIIFPQSSANVCQRLMNTQLQGKSEDHCSGKHGPNDHKKSGNTRRTQANALGANGKHVSALVPHEVGGGDANDPSAKDADLQPLFDNITVKLKKLPLVGSSCEFCCSNCMVSKDADMTQQRRVQPVPCPHSLSLMHTPEAYNMKVFEDAIAAKSALQDVYRRNAECNNSVDVYASQFDISKRVCPAISLPRSVTAFENVDHSNGPTMDDDDDVDVEHLLTYRPETVQGDGYSYTGRYKAHNENPFEGAEKDASLLENLDVTVLRDVASRITSKSKTKVDVSTLLNELSVSKGDDSKVQFSRDSTIALTGDVVDRHDHKRLTWVCPNEFRVVGVMREQQPAPRVTSLRYGTHDDTFTTRRFSTRDGSSTTHSFSAYPSRALDMVPIGQLGRLGTTTSGLFSFDSTDDMYYDNDMTLDTLMAKYLRLRKDPNCLESIRKTLKHLICFRLRKKRLYLKPRKNTSDSAPGSATRGDNIMETTLQHILSRIGFYEGGAYSMEDIPNMDGLDDNASIYTYSSISVSSYQSVTESVFIDIDTRALMRSIKPNLHDNMVDAYGILTVYDENHSNTIPKNRAEMYCELIGHDLYLYSLKTHAQTAADMIEREPRFILHLDESFTCVPLNDRKTGNSLLRITGANYTTNGKNLMSKDDEAAGPSDDGGNGDDDESYMFYFKLFSTQDDLVRWYRVLCARSKLLSFLSLLENQHQVAPYNWNIFFMLYPKLMEVDLSHLVFDIQLESRIVNSYLKPPVRRLVASYRDMSDTELVGFMSTWNCEIDRLDLSNNGLTIRECGTAFVEFLHRANVRHLCLDQNPLSPEAFDLLGAMFTGGVLQTVTMRGCRIDEKIIPVLKQLNQKMDLKDKFCVDVRDCSGSDETLHFLKSYPFNRMKVITVPSQGEFKEPAMMTFVDCKNFPEIKALGAIFDGRLLSAHSVSLQRGFNLWRFPQNNIVNLKFCGLCRRKPTQYTLANEYMFFEYKAPYLVGYDPQTQGKSKGKNDKRPSVSHIFYITSCDIAVMNKLRWLQLTGTPPKSVKVANYDSKTIMVRAYTDASTRRWFEIINRTLSGIRYVEYLRNHPDVTPSKHILHFCSTPDAAYLVLYELPRDRDFWMGFFRCINSQSMLRVVDFSNMKLTTDDLSFPTLLFGGVTLDRLDYSFNNVRLTDAKEDIFNALLPPLTCRTYNISHNPLGDCRLSALLFVDACMKAEAVKVCFNYCELGDDFLSHAITLLSQINHGSDEPRLELVELEGNQFAVHTICDFVGVLTATFPSVVSIRLHNSVVSPQLTETMLDKHLMSVTERFSATEPAFGHFMRKKHVRKPKRTTRESVEKLIQERQGITPYSSRKVTPRQL